MDHCSAVLMNTHNKEISLALGLTTWCEIQDYPPIQIMHHPLKPQSANNDQGIEKKQIESWDRQWASGGPLVGLQ